MLAGEDNNFHLNKNQSIKFPCNLRWTDSVRFDLSNTNTENFSSRTNSPSKSSDIISLISHASQSLFKFALLPSNNRSINSRNRNLHVHHLPGVRSTPVDRIVVASRGHVEWLDNKTRLGRGILMPARRTALISPRRNENHSYKSFLREVTL